MLLRVINTAGPLVRATRRALHRARNQAARRYIRADVGIQGFCAALEAAQVRYVVLRWFESLPEVPEGEDIDVLAADEALGKIEPLLSRSGGVECDIYSKSGRPGTRYRGMAYYPPYLAESILERSVLHAGWCRVPCVEDHFFSLSYHALYHKGLESGVPTSTPGLVSKRCPAHDYRATLSSLAKQLGLEADVTMEALDELLARRGWRPPYDTVQRLADHNEWLRQQQVLNEASLSSAEKCLTMFFLRREAVDSGCVWAAVKGLSDRGFNILLVSHLSESESHHCAQRIRGGDWGPGAFPLSGGQPAVAIAGCDLNPRPPSAAQRRRYPVMDNGRIAEVKTAVRRLLNERRAPDAQCNMLHSSDNALEAWDYARIAVGSHEGYLRRQLELLRERYTTRARVLRDLTRNGRRSKVELIEFQGGPALRKTFRPGAERYCAREIAFLRRFAGTRDEFPPLLKTAPNWFVLPYYEDQLGPFRHNGGLLPRPLLPLPVARQMLDVLRFIHSQGYGVFDAGPHNFVLSATSGLKMIDFEFAYPCSTDVPFERCYSFAGPPADFEGDLPIEWSGQTIPYDFHWRPYIGLSLRSLLIEPTWLQIVRRAQYQWKRLLVSNGRRLRRQGRRMVAAVRQ
jgi:hypothetical protein